MKAVLLALNQLVSERVIEGYAIGGAVGAAFYISAAQTEDVDAFVFLPSQGSALVSLSPVYERLVALGGIVEREYVRFGDWPLQILTDANPLIAEAIQEAVSTEFEGVSTRVFTAEHLCAIALNTGRSKDFLRVSQFLVQEAVDVGPLSSVLKRFHLVDEKKRLDLLVREIAERRRDGDR